MLDNVLKAFGIEGNPELYGNGHINTTYRISNQYILQRINTEVFPNPQGVMDNVFAVTEHIREKLQAKGESTDRKTIEYIRTLDGKKMYTGEEGCFRAYKFIDDVYTVDDKKTPEILYNASKAIGKFQKMLADFKAEDLFTVIPNFHNTPKRFENLVNAVNKNVAGRKDSCQELIDYAYSLKPITSYITDAIADGSVPLRVSHNDTKLNNVLFDNTTGEGICLIDLDTVMSGSYLYDFGDAMRFGAASAAEDCTDLDKVYFDLAIFEAFAKGYLESAADVLTDGEKKLLFSSCMIMTYECGIRFLTDYLEGDTYFRTHYEKHNYDRAANQLKLVKDMLAKKDEAEAIVKKYL